MENKNPEHKKRKEKQEEKKPLEMSLQENQDTKPQATQMLLTKHRKATEDTKDSSSNERNYSN